MRILFCTQSSSLRLFHALNSALASEFMIDRVGYTLADSYNYSLWLNEMVGFENEGHYLLKEWEVTRERSLKPDLQKLAWYDREIGGEAGLFGAIVADRRLYMGPDCVYTQDYRRRFTDDELLCILQRGLEEMERLFAELKPDVLFSFICVTMLDYLAYLFAKARGIRILNLRPTRVGDRVSFSNTLNDPSPELVASYRRLGDGETSEFQQEARNYIKRVREEHGRYEGVVRPSDKPALKANTLRFIKPGRIVSAVRKYIGYRLSAAATDNHVPDPLRSMVFSALINPIRAKKARVALKLDYVYSEDLKEFRYLFFPLHTEPEVSLLVYGRPYVNQIEIIRMLSMSLPIDMVLLVKEHPWMVGKRSINAYKKMLNTPRVRIADPKLEARTLIQESELVSVITGSVALEAAMLGKPVITFGDCPYNILPESMVRYCVHPRHVQTIVRKAISEYAANEVALENYVAAVFETSVSANLYSVLLDKKNVHSEQSGSYENEIAKMAQNANSILRMQNTYPVPDVISAKW